MTRFTPVAAAALLVLLLGFGSGLILGKQEQHEDPRVNRGQQAAPAYTHWRYPGSNMNSHSSGGAYSGPNYHMGPYHFMHYTTKDDFGKVLAWYANRLNMPNLPSANGTYSTTTYNNIGPLQSFVTDHSRQGRSTSAKQPEVKVKTFSQRAPGYHVLFTVMQVEEEPTSISIQYFPEQ